MDQKKPKPKTCKAPGCRERFTPARPLQVACSPRCAVKYAERKRATREAKQEKQWREHKRQWKENNEPYNELIKKTQKAFNEFIRERDYFDNCICCGMVPAQQAVGGAWDCGHYRSVGSAPHLRFNEDNAHKQRKQCNRDKSGNIQEYRKRLIHKIGLTRVEQLEHDNRPRNYTRAELVEMAKDYRRRARELRKEREKQLSRGNG